MKNKKFDQGQAFDWGKTSEDYAKYRDIYPQSLYKKLTELGIGTKGQQVLDLGTGTGVLPRAMYHYGAHFTGIDASENQIKLALQLTKAQNQQIKFEYCEAENIDFPEDTFDAITAVQCFHYFKLDLLLPSINKILKKDGKLAIVHMIWLPDEDDLVKASEALILKYNPYWSGGGMQRLQLKDREGLKPYFEVMSQITFDEAIPFSREGWLGRVRASRGIGATLSQEKITQFDQEHMQLIAQMRPESFTVLHQLTIEVYQLL